MFTRRVSAAGVVIDCRKQTRQIKLSAEFLNCLNGGPASEMPILAFSAPVTGSEVAQIHPIAIPRCIAFPALPALPAASASLLGQSVSSTIGAGGEVPCG